MKNNLFTIICLVGVLGVAAFYITSQNSGPWVAPAEADKLINPHEGKHPGAKGENLFTNNCERCHGNEGKGDGVDGKKLNPKPADLTSENVQKQSDGAIFWKLSNGRGQMLAFKNTLTEDDRWTLVNYIRELGKKKSEVSYLQTGK